MSVTAVAGLAALSLVFALAWLVAKVRRWGLLPQDTWAIGIYRGTAPLELTPHPEIGDRPVIVAEQIRDAAADFVADPFLFRREGRWYLFFEILERKLWRGCIAVATSSDGLRWDYDRVVLREPFHLSYPYVVQEGDEVFMVPESARAGSIRLYRACPFPYRWEFDRVLVDGAYYDPSLVRHGGRWWMFASDPTHSLHLFHAKGLHGPWVEHAASPVVRHDLRTARCGGRVLDDHGVLTRFAQDGRDGYGSRLWAFRIEVMDEARYAESEVPNGPVLGATGTGWTATGMHQIDVQSPQAGQWIAAVDGNAQRLVVKWRAGLRRLQSELRDWRARRTRA